MENQEKEIVRTVGLCAETAEILQDFEDFIAVSKRVQHRVEDQELFEDTQKDFAREIVYQLFDSIVRNTRLEDGKVVAV